ncbi:N-acetyltransferase family protein [Actinosynnema sp. CS-041913]|uniref:GNAT family N-acetyltransferase n=1 Tax=Actinosynnema sp. CS-041913 TaxID=3239917 RepID=UPI003D942428
MTTVTPLRPDDRAAWEVLARGYKAFYRTEVADEDYARVWHRLLAGDAIHGLAARSGDTLVGITHYLFHANVWSAGACYLQDLYVAEQARGLGAARALIEAVADATRAHGAVRLYWNTMHDNTTARALYDKVAVHRGFVVYEHPLD